MGLSSIPIYGEEDGYRPTLEVSCSSLRHGLTKCMEFVTEELLDTDFSDVSRVREILGEFSSSIRETLLNSGHMVALTAANKAIDSASAYKSAIIGVEFYRFVSKLYKSSDAEIISAVGKMKEAVKAVLGKDNLIISLTCTKEMAKELSDKLCILTDRLPMVRTSCLNKEPRGPLYEKKEQRSAVKSSGEVYYAAVSGKIAMLSPEDQGLLMLAASIVSSDFLWNKVRIVNGAYGVGMSYNIISRVTYFYSYRDPKFKDSLEAYRSVVSYLENFNVDEREMTKYVIGQIGTADTPISASALGNISLVSYLDNSFEEDRKKRRKAVLTATPEKIRKMAGVVAALFDRDNYCVVGNETGIMSEKDMFDSIENLL